MLPHPKRQQAWRKRYQFSFKTPFPLGLISRKIPFHRKNQPINKFNVLLTVTFIEKTVYLRDKKV